jgi:hypothetical protein
VDIVPELPRNHPVKRDHEDIMTVDAQSSGVQDSLDAAHKTERLATSWASDAAEGRRVRIDKNGHLCAADVLVPRVRHRE